MELDFFSKQQFDILGNIFCFVCQGLVKDTDTCTEDVKLLNSNLLAGLTMKTDNSSPGSVQREQREQTFVQIR